MNQLYLRQQAGEIRATDDNLDKVNYVKLEMNWEYNICHCQIKNSGTQEVKLSEVVLFKGALPYDIETSFYGEGYNMLSQYGGTLKNPINIGVFSDKHHYKLPQKEGYFTVYNMILFSPVQESHTLLGFTSCHRFRGEIRIGDGDFEIVMVLEGISLQPGEVWKMEEFMIESHIDHNQLLDIFGKRIAYNHPRLEFSKPITGWCSWYCYGPFITEEIIFNNMEKIQQKIPELKYIQIDDGYQKYMGDWFEWSDTFTNKIELFGEIRKRGFEPAIWVAPFIAEEKSRIFQEHPDWFIQSEEGKPLPSDQVSFGGWRCGPWFMLDCTHPDALDYIKNTFQQMRLDWGIHYFKLDALMWSAMPFGKRYIQNITSVEMYRMGMEAIIEGAGPSSYILAANSPMWPSFGLVHGMRVTGDITREWGNMKQLAKECFWRNWQNNRVWINDPDCLVIEDIMVETIAPDGSISKNAITVSEDEYSFHVAHIFSSGSVVISSDRYPEMKKEEIVRKLISTNHTQARFDDLTFTIGRIESQEGPMISVFNRNNEKTSFKVPLNGRYQIIDFISDEVLGVFEEVIKVDLNAHAAKILLCKAIIS